MSLSLKKSRIFRWLIRLFKYSAGLFLVVLLLAMLILVLLPTVVSTDWSRELIQKQASKALDRPVTIRQLDWSWSDGIIIKNLVIPDLPEFSETSLVTLEQVGFRPDIKSLLHRNIRVDFLVSGLNVNIIKNPAGTINIEALGKQSLAGDLPAAPAEKTEPPGKKEGDKKQDKEDKKDTKPFVLPSVINDIAIDIRLTGINLLYDDRLKKETYRITHLDVLLDAASLKSAPINLTLETDITVNETLIPRSTLTAAVQHLFTDDGHLNVNGCMARLNADLPGLIADVNADMTASEMAADIKIDLASLMDAAAPLIPGFPGSTTISGNMTFTASSGIDPDNPLAFDAALSATDLAVSGKLLDGKSVGPGNISIHLNGMADVNTEQFTLQTGEVLILENSAVQMSAAVKQFKQDNKTIHLTIAPLYLDIDEIVSFAKPFIPQAIEIPVLPGKTAFISLAKLDFDGQMPEGRSDVRLDNLNIHVPGIALTDKTDGKPKLRVSGGRINLKTLTASLADLFPTTASFYLSLAADNLISGRNPTAVAISNIRMDRLYAETHKFAKADFSRFGIAGAFSLDNQLTIDTLTLPDLIQINDLTQSLQVNADISADSTITASLDHLDAAGGKIAVLSVLKKGAPSLDTPIDIHLALDNLFIKDIDTLGIDTPTLDIKNFIARLTAKNAISLTLTADAVNASDTADTSFQADLKIDSDLAALTRIIPEQLLSGISGSGDLNISLNAAGRRPDAEEIDSLKRLQLTDNLGFIHQLDLNIGVDNGAIAVSKAGGPKIQVTAFSGQPFIQYGLSGKTGKGTITSDIRAGSVTGLPGIDGNTPMSGEFTLSGDHQYLTSIDVNQFFSIEPAGVEETINISIDGLDKIMTQSPLPALPLWLSKLSADIFAGINIPQTRMLKKSGIPGLGAIDLKGLLAADMAFRLRPDQSVGGNVALTVKEMNVSLPQTVLLENIDANLDFSKSYAIASPKQQPVISETAGLSLTIFQADGPSAAAVQNTDIYRHIRYLHERRNPKPAVSFAKADIMAAPFPLTIDESMFMLNLDNGLPNLDYFQFNLLGGTVNGSIALLKAQNRFNLNTALTFSGINTARIFPRAFSKADYSAADISGALYADVPVTDQLQYVLENAAIRIEFTRIGSRAMERLLYALDPYESNEAIVTQRRFLKNGSPKNIRMEIRDGFFSLSGEVTIKGIDISLPAIRRLNIATVPGFEKFEKNLAGLTPVIEILQKASAEKIMIDKETSAITFE